MGSQRGAWSMTWPGPREHKALRESRCTLPMCALRFPQSRLAALFVMRRLPRRCCIAQTLGISSSALGLLISGRRICLGWVRGRHWRYWSDWIHRQHRSFGWDRCHGSDRRTWPCWHIHLLFAGVSGAAPPNFGNFICNGSSASFLLYCGNLGQIFKCSGPPYQWDFYTGFCW